MNFYFCEGCGKRITEIDIDQGKARNKQLKGVYCSLCAQGVNTMTMLPVTDAELVDEPAQRASSSAMRVAAAEQPGERRSAAPSPAKPSSNTVIFGIAIGGTLVLAAAVMLLSGSKPAATAQPAAPVVTSTQVIAPPAILPPSLAASPPEVSESTPATSPDSTPPAAKEIPTATAPQTPPPAPEVATNVETPSTKPPEVTANRSPEPERPNDVPESATPPAQEKKIERAWMSYAKFEELVLGAGRLSEIQISAQAALETVEPADKPACTILANCLDQAASVESAVLASLAQKKGSKLSLLRSDGTRQLVEIADDGHANIHVEELAFAHLQEFTRDQFKDADARIAAFVALRGDPETAKRLAAPLDPALRGALEKIIDVRRVQVREVKAAEELKKFSALMAKNSPQALALGRQILKNYDGCKALAEMNPPLQAQLAEIQSGSIELRNIFLCEAKRLSDGRIELNFDLKNPRTLMEFVNRGLPGWFTELDAEITLENDGRWNRIFTLGDTVLTQSTSLAQSIAHLGKTTHQDPPPNPKKDDYYGPGGGVHHYHLKAGAAGISFQVDNETPQVAPGAWAGGRLKWPGHNKTIPQALKLTARFDALWLSEMADVAKDRARFLAGELVEIKPRLRQAPRTELEPAMMCYGYSAIKEARPLVGWNEIGPSFSSDGAEFISPKPGDKKRTEWMAAFWPQALIAPNAELAFEARIDAGHIDVLLPSDKPAGQVGGNRFAVISNDRIKVMDIEVFSANPMRQESTVHAEAPYAGQPGKWRQIQLLYTKGALIVGIDGKQVLEYKGAPHVIYPMQFWANQSVDYRLRNIKIRKLE